MTREESIKWLKLLKTSPLIYGEYTEAIDMAIESLSADKVEVVRCKDCKASRVYGKTTQWLACEMMEGQATDPDGYCYLGERKEHGKHGE